MSKKQKGSKNREKARTRLAGWYGKVVNQRNDFLHKLSRLYVKGGEEVDGRRVVYRPLWK